MLSMAAKAMALIKFIVGFLSVDVVFADVHVVTYWAIAIGRQIILNSEV